MASNIGLRPSCEIPPDPPGDFYLCRKAAAHRLHICPNQGLFCARFAQPAFLCIKRRNFRRTRFSPILCVHLHPSAGWLQGSPCQRFLLPPAFSFCRRWGGCRGQVLGIEVGFDLLGQLQPGLVLRVGVGVHQDSSRCVACIALHRLEVAIRLQQLVGGTGVPQTVEHDLFKLWMLGSSQAVPLCQQLRCDGQAVREPE